MGATDFSSGLVGYLVLAVGFRAANCCFDSIAGSLKTGHSFLNSLLCRLKQFSISQINLAVGGEVDLELNPALSY